MKYLFSLMLLLIPTVAQAIVLDFDDFSGSTNGISYGGLIWSETDLPDNFGHFGMYHTDRVAIDGSAGLNGLAFEVKTEDDSVFNFLSFDINSQGHCSEFTSPCVGTGAPGTLEILGYRGDLLVSSMTSGYVDEYIFNSEDPSSSYSTPLHLSANFMSIDRLVVRTKSTDSFDLDNFEYDQVSAVPEPATFMLFLVGLLGLVFRRRYC